MLSEGSQVFFLPHPWERFRVPEIPSPLSELVKPFRKSVLGQACRCLRSFPWKPFGRAGFRILQGAQKKSTIRFYWLPLLSTAASCSGKNTPEFNVCRFQRAEKKKRNQEKAWAPPHAVAQPPPFVPGQSNAGCCGWTQSCTALKP